MVDRSSDWFRQAEADLAHARAALEDGHFDWSCFAAQQAAEKALKAVHLARHGDPWGHAVLALLRALPEQDATALPEALIDAAKALDRDYIQTRYPNGFAEGAPVDYYTARNAREAIAHAEAILSFCRSHLR
jgi:HEPN domain-containing protein